ncbi:MAG: serine/threonine protein kinase, partial [Elusimicrobiales bacterium]
MTDDLIRKTFAGCLVLEKIGQGGMGVVYKAHHITLNKIVCIKLLPKELEADKRNIDFFLREAEISKQLDHPNTVHVYDYGRERDRYYIVMSYVEGKSLEVIVKEKGYLGVEEAS